MPARKTKKNHSKSYSQDWIWYTTCQWLGGVGSLTRFRTVICPLRTLQNRWVIPGAGGNSPCPDVVCDGISGLDVITINHTAKDNVMFEMELTYQWDMALMYISEMYQGTWLMSKVIYFASCWRQQKVTSMYSDND